jgi:hypothetical protein
MKAILLVVLRLGIEVVVLLLALRIAGFVIKELYHRKGYTFPPPPSIVARYVWIIGFGIILLLNLSELFQAASPQPPPNAASRDTIYIVKPAPVTTSAIVDPARPKPTRFYVALTLLALGSIVVIATSIPDLMSNNSRRVARGGASILVAGSLAWSAFEEFHLFQFDVENLLSVKFARTSALTFRPMGDIGPFVEATADSLEPGARVINGVDSVVSNIKQQLDHNAISLVLLLGGVDKRQLRTGSAAAFGSNEALAKARARWTANLLKRRIPKLAKLGDSIEFVTLSTGSSYFGGVSASDSLRADRRVRVLVSPANGP